MLAGVMAWRCSWAPRRLRAALEGGTTQQRRQPEEEHGRGILVPAAKERTDGHAACGAEGGEGGSHLAGSGAAATGYGTGSRGGARRAGSQRQLDSDGRRTASGGGTGRRPGRGWRRLQGFFLPLARAFGAARSGAERSGAERLTLCGASARPLSSPPSRRAGRQRQGCAREDQDCGHQRGRHEQAVPQVSEPGQGSARAAAAQLGRRSWGCSWEQWWPSACCISRPSASAHSEPFNLGVPP